LFFRLTKEEEEAVSLLTWFFLPGTVIHELSHLLIAELLRVRTGELSFRPEIKEDDRIRAGSLKMARTDPLRHSLIGLAPILAGLAIITSLVHFILVPLFQKNLSISFLPLNYQSIIINLLSLLLATYLLFIISNTMFSSKKDLETILVPLIIIAILGGAFWLGKIRISLSPQVISFSTNLFKKLNWALLGTAIIDLVFLGLLKLLLKPRSSEVRQS